MKDYKKILEGVVDIINATEKSDIGFVNICTYIGENCPELKESEDEKIRKDIISYLKSSTAVSPKTWIEWLEKQGEHAKFRDSIQVGDKVTRNQDGMLVNLSQLNRVAKKDEKQGEQKPTDKVEQGQEELTEFEKAVKQVMEEAIECGDTHNLKADADMLLRLVQKSSWSEEDERRIEECAREAEDNNCIILARHIRQLKSLRLQSTWKPSGEQMDMLAKVCSTLHLTSGENEIMESIYDALKKLRKE